MTDNMTDDMADDMADETNTSRPGTDTAALLAAAKAPTAEWLESCFGAGSLWRPTEAELPERLEDGESRTFLTTIGFPAVHLAFVDFDSTSLRRKGLWEEDPAELFGERRPDDDSPPERYAYGLGEQYAINLMLMGDTGSIQLYDPNGWDHAAGHAGWAADGLPAITGALGLLARYEDRLTGDDAAAALEEFRSLLAALEPGLEPCRFWDNIFDVIEDEYIH
ncbi:SUKH-4 family immunity protein [Streptomyces chattanoogensis]